MKYYIRQFLILFTLIYFNQTFAQVQNFPVFTYGNDTVYSDEFLRVFNKNRKEGAKPTEAEINDYLQLYTKFKIKVKDAYDRQLDTMPQFLKELIGYRKTLASPYLRDKEVTQKLVDEAYQRGLYEVNASHILINCPVNASSMDTLKAYHKLMELRKRIIDGEAFDEVAKSFSDDPSAASNGGNLGYFSVFQMIYPFESAAYNTAVGDISMPIRTRFGYHIIKVHDKRKATGDIQAAHIMIRFNQPKEADSLKPRIDAIYESLTNGASWDELCSEFTEDFGTKNMGGRLSPFNRTTANIPEEFRQAAFSITNDGDFSKPFKTAFGWHIVKRIGQTPIPTLQEKENTLKRRIERDSRSEKSKEAVLKRIKIENNYQYIGGLKQITKYFDESLLNGTWKKPESFDTIFMFKIGDKKYYNHNFFDFVSVNQVQSEMEIEERIEDLFGQYTDFENLRYEEEILDQKYDDFKHIMTEYKDGILLFELTDKLVWSKAVEDSVGLEKFYNENIENYMWSPRLDLSIFSIKEESPVKRVTKLARKPKNDVKILSKYNKDDVLMVKIDHKKMEKKDAPWMSEIKWKTGVYNIGKENDRFKVVRVNEVLPEKPKALKEIMGVVTSDYQNFLEKAWIEELISKYPISIFSENIPKLLH
jgi:peptidyl-prolyl cis-trans isomerase SurA